MTLDIMMPFYGRFDHFRVAVESVLAQTDQDWRLVIVDDVYPDLAPGEWARSLGDPRIEVLRNAENLGVSRNFDRCIDLATADRCVLMGCDDELLPDFVARMSVLATEFPEADLIQPGVEVIDEDGHLVRPVGDRVKALLRPRGPKPELLSGQRLTTSLLRGNWAYFPSVSWKVATVRRFGFRHDLQVVQDLALMMEIFRNGGSLVVDDVPVFRYRRHTGSVSSYTAVDGRRFQQERQVFAEESERQRALGWTKSARVARTHLTSRLNAILQLPKALSAKDRAGLKVLRTHILS
ncbi:glycosyltransferase family 2 protein [Plantibacter sp. VKM Ac-2885]|uniref:glycosyltransferase family 2 protein n=1 Tax=Plantibacter TaxID=190323 RepID=UPI0010C15B9E|nr:MULTISPECIES: glycosyltransferase family 2 protein [Plantibacter]MBD8103553.1 glycosyltransferase family 2 protein [Plantibacter sp. CFBP 8775]MBD8516593.1 glycosyltransferase family 2 protein [Plantibacter sp. CFBP 8804]MBF4514396.1 glycosyltransferase family 2 protein [Plantibacter sp. VKM Ac-2885]MBD8533868.1 glycosyltransferase family 2 protein [Plantibacter sp. CFBP 13570]TKJ96514.1 glycosyl transferase family 2 [Plantibacter flavus]